jgi:hypothetical protein
VRGACAFVGNVKVSFCRQSTQSEAGLALQAVRRQVRCISLRHASRLTSACVVSLHRYVTLVLRGIAQQSKDDQYNYEIAISPDKLELTVCYRRYLSVRQMSRLSLQLNVHYKVEDASTGTSQVRRMCLLPVASTSSHALISAFALRRAFCCAKSSSQTDILCPRPEVSGTIDCIILSKE